MWHKWFKLILVNAHRRLTRKRRHFWTKSLFLSSFKFLCVNITEDLTWTTHTVSSEEDPPVSHLPQATEEIWSELKNPQTVLQLHCGEHPDWLHHRLVQELHSSQPESPEENSSDGPAHRRRWASLPPGHLHPAMCEESTEDHLLPPEPWTLLAATIRQTVPQHQDPNQQNARQLILAGYQTAELQIANYTHPPTPHTGFHLHTTHTDSDSTVACLALHSIEHMQLHLLFCTNKLLNSTVKH